MKAIDMRTETKKPSFNPDGRKPKSIDLDLLEKLCQIHCTDEEICSILSISHDTLLRRKKSAEFLQLMETARANGRASLRRMQWQAAQGGSIPMMIFLGKNLLRQRDRFEDEEPKESPTDKAREVANALKAMIETEKGRK